MRRATWVLLGCAVLTAGCDRGWGISGRVTTKTPSSEEAVPVEGATVQVRCPDDVPLQTQSNGKGKFSYSRLGVIDDECTIEVSAPGLESRTYTVAEVCQRRYSTDESCGSMELDAVLVPPPLGG